MTLLFIFFIMKMNHGILISLACLALVAGCKKSPQPTPAPEPDPVPVEQEKIPIRLSAAVTKVTDLSFENADEVGLYVVNRDGSSLSASGNHLTNVPFTFDGSAWTAPQASYWKDQSTHADFYVYYPYVSSVTDISAIPFSISSDQSTQDKYKTCDVLWGTSKDIAPSGDPVPVKMYHSLSNILVYLVPGRGYTEETLSQQEVSLLVGGTVLEGNLNLSDGTVTAKGTPSDITPFKEDDHYRAMIVPQTIEDVTLISIRVGDDSYSLTRSGTFEGGKQYKCTLTINKVAEGISIGIGDWEEGDEDFGGVVG